VTENKSRRIALNARPDLRRRFGRRHFLARVVPRKSGSSPGPAPWTNGSDGSERAAVASSCASNQRTGQFDRTTIEGRRQLADAIREARSQKERYQYWKGRQKHRKRE